MEERVFTDMTDVPYSDPTLPRTIHVVQKVFCIGHLPPSLVIDKIWSFHVAA